MSNELVLLSYAQESFKKIQSRFKTVEEASDIVVFLQQLDLFSKSCLSLTATIHEKLNTYSKRIPTLVLGLIFQFVFDDVIGKLVCKSWHAALESPLTKRLCSSLCLQKLKTTEFWDLQFSPRVITFDPISKHIHVFGGSSSKAYCVLNLEGKILSKWYTPYNVFCAACDLNYMCIAKEEKIILLRLSGTYSDNCYRHVDFETPVREWTINGSCKGLRIYNEIIYFTTTKDIINKLGKCSLDTLEPEWLYGYEDKFQDLQTVQSLRLWVDADEIFVAGNPPFPIDVFSLDGTRLRGWNTCKKDYKQTDYCVWGLAVSKGLVFVVDSFKNRIQVFNRSGRLLWQIVNPATCQDMSDIFCYEGNLYVSDWKMDGIWMFELS